MRAFTNTSLFLTAAGNFEHVTICCYNYCHKQLSNLSTIQIRGYQILFLPNIKYGLSKRRWIFSHLLTSHKVAKVFS